MSDNTPTGSAGSLANLDKSQGLEVMLLLAQRLTRDLATAPALASRSLTPEAYSVLVTLGTEAGSPIAKISKRSAPSSSSLRAARKSLLEAGLIAEGKGEGDKASYALTEKGTATVAAIRAELAETMAGVSDKSWRALSRTASLIRSVSQSVSGPRVKKTRPARQPKARKAKA